MDIKNAIYALVSQIPKGKVTTYGQIAKTLKLTSPRLVGRILHANTNPQQIPCHRVVFADGKLSVAYVFGGYRKQKEILIAEGVVFKGDKVDLTKSFL